MLTSANNCLESMLLLEIEYFSNGEKWGELGMGKDRFLRIREKRREKEGWK